MEKAKPELMPEEYGVCECGANRVLKDLKIICENSDFCDISESLDEFKQRSKLSKKVSAVFNDVVNASSSQTKAIPLIRVYQITSDSDKENVKGKDKAKEPPTKSNEGFFLKVDEEAREVIRQNFHSKTPLVTMCVAGLIGTGKSTWLNAFLYYVGKLRDVESAFEIGHSQLTQTEGIWMFPEPIFLPGNDSFQILLCDMEGMGGIRDGSDQKATEELLQKLYLAGLLISSAFIIHFSFRPSVSEISLLTNMFQVAEELKATLGIEIPKVDVLIRDTDELTTNKGKTFREVILNSCKIPENLVKILQFFPRGKVPSEYLYDKEKKIKNLSGSNYVEEMRKIAIKISEQIKMKPGFNSQITSDEFINILNELETSLNQPDFTQAYLASLEQNIFDLIYPETQLRSAKFLEKTIEEAKNFDVKKNESQFSAHIEALKKQVNDEFVKFVKDTCKRDFSSSKALQGVVNTFRNNVKADLGLEIFLRRKIAHETDEKRKKELKDLESKISESNSQNAKMQKEQQEKMIKLEKTANDERLARIAAEDKLRKQVSDLNSERARMQQEQMNQFRQLASTIKVRTKTTVPECRYCGSSKTRLISCRKCSNFVCYDSCGMICCTSCGKRFRGCEDHAQIYCCGKWRSVR